MCVPSKKAHSSSTASQQYTAAAAAAAKSHKASPLIPQQYLVLSLSSCVWKVESTYPALYSRARARMKWLFHSSGSPYRHRRRRRGNYTPGIAQLSRRGYNDHRRKT